jgi:hypothetical protein
MRTAIYDHLNTVNLGSFRLTNELPWTSSGTPLYLKNPKTIYVDMGQESSDLAFPTLDASIKLTSNTSTVRVYFANDAKMIPADYATLLSNIKTARNIDTVPGVNQREVDVSTTFESDLMVTELEFRFTKLT